MLCKHSTGVLLSKKNLLHKISDRLTVDSNSIGFGASLTPYLVRSIFSVWASRMFSMCLVDYASVRRTIWSCILISLQLNTKQVVSLPCTYDNISLQMNKRLSSSDARGLSANTHINGDRTRTVSCDMHRMLLLLVAQGAQALVQVLLSCPLQILHPSNSKNECWLSCYFHGVAIQQISRTMNKTYAISTSIIRKQGNITSHLSAALSYRVLS